MPYRDSVIHLGIPNLPSATATSWIKTFAAFTASPSMKRLEQILSELNDLTNVLMVFNHPAWNLNKVGAERHRFCIHEFMTNCGRFTHAEDSDCNLVQ